jgi:peptide/nickel transport system substrate-binding protein
LEERRTPRWGRCGVFLFFALAAAGCRSGNSQPLDRDAPTELIVGFPEGNVGGADVGPNQFRSVLSQEGLISTISPDGRLLPRLAASWQWEQEEQEARRLRVRLRPGVYFHDGTKMTSSVVADILRAAIKAPRILPSYSSFTDITSIRSEGDLDVVLELSQPSAFLPDDLDMPLSLPAGVATGPFRVVKRDASEVVLERFDRYWQGKPAIERIRVKTFDALRTAWSSLLRGEVDMVTDVPAEAVEFMSNDQADVLQYKRRYQYMVAFNSRHPALSPARVRRALNLAVDRSSLVQRALRGFGSPATGPLWPKHWAYDNSVTPFAFNQRQAVALLDGAGFIKGRAGGQSNLPSARLQFTCLLIEGFSLHERLGLELQKQLYDIGVDMQFEVVSLDAWNDRIRDGKFEAVLVDMISGPSFGRPFIFWRSAKKFDGLNKFGWENAEAEGLFKELRESALDETKTRDATEKLQRVFLEDPPALFLAWSERARVVGPKFTPVIDDDRDPVLTMWRWTPAENRLAAAR